MTRGSVRYSEETIRYSQAACPSVLLPFFFQNLQYTEMEYARQDQRLDSEGNVTSINFDEFYAERVANFERERTLFDHYIRLIKPEHNEAHDLEWESRNLIEESRLAKQAVDGVDAKLKSLQLEIENVSKDIYLLTEAKTMRDEQIARLMHLARPVGRDVAYLYKDLFPSRSDSKSAKSTKAAAVKTTEQKQQESAQQLFKVVKTGEVLKLEGRLQDETMRAMTYLRDLQIAIKEADEERRKSRLFYQVLRDEDVQAGTKLWQEVDRNEFQCFHAVAELLRLRYRILVAQRLEVVELEKLQQDKEQFICKEEQAKEQVCKSALLLYNLNDYKYFLFSSSFFYPIYYQSIIIGDVCMMLWCMHSLVVSHYIQVHLLLY
ncbi:hypothetical protein EON63_07820 [archaeon]|nr:MAG: hypothetical protein EON63_07820 [archaeon]